MSDTAVPPYPTEQTNHPYYEPVPGSENTETPDLNSQEKAPQETVTSLLPTSGNTEELASDKQAGTEELHSPGSSKKEPTHPQQPINLEGVDRTTADADKAENELITGIIEEHEYQT